MNYDYEIYMDDDIITIHKHDDTYFDIILQYFWIWVRENNLHLWVNDFYNPAQYDGHGQETGEYTKDEYFALPYDHIKADLDKYLIKRKFKKHFDL